MAEAEEIKKFCVERAKLGRANCKKCKQAIGAKTVRLAKIAPNPFGSGTMKQWYHPACLFQVFSKQRASTAKIETLDDMGGWDDLDPDAQKEILDHLPDSARVRKQPQVKIDEEDTSEKIDPNHKDCSLREFRKLCSELAEHPSYLDKTSIVNKFINGGTSGDGFKGDLLLTVRLLLPGVIKRIYNLQSKQIVKLFSRLFNADQDMMLTSLEDGDVAETIRIFFEESHSVKPATKSLLSLQDVDRFLNTLSDLTREEDQLSHFLSIVPQCTGNDLKLIIRLIKHDLRINAGAKHILEAVHPDAYGAFQSSRDINSIISKIKGNEEVLNSKQGLKIGISVLTPVLPMLAQACKSADEALKKCPNGMFADIKYDGERVQVHKKGNEFKYLSRSLKPVLPHKVRSLQEYIPKAFPHGRDLVLDCEVLLMDTISGKPLPFGTLGIHKKNEFQDANVCLFVFDCIFYNGESLVNKPIKERRQILLGNMTEIPHRVVFSEMKEIYNKKDLEALMVKVFKEGLEGLVLKDTMSLYEPGKRHWLKIKKDYLFGGAMADTADLVVLGAWYGTGQKGGMMSVFLMGCYDEDRRVWCTVTKVHTGHDDATLESLQSELKMVKISKDITKVPSWLKCTKTMVPDFVAADPKNQPVWEITGAELTKHIVHTADGISVRFPRVTRIRDDKQWDTATSLAELKELFKNSKETSDFSLSGYIENNDSSSSTGSPKKKQKLSDQSIKTFAESVSSPSSESELSDRKRKDYKIKHPLPNIFQGIKVVMPSDNKVMSRYAQQVLPRYFVAYGGEILDSDNSHKATHYFFNNNGESSSVKRDGVAISSSWLLNCVTNQLLQPIPHYSPVVVS